ncbi:MAG: single-stranded-DNA-specific exonuclease RecJ [Planctomycetota bacterium]|nr:MAG: single-stranded-DNA-specific exonuclease RecJ [Planctomycetota bacterium]REJ96821.1 MAG: single-stranded-DNA-specific exonuclease RecJ [Planctomycetota bacterium]REK24010.1 MAG: single-stranded-DNA-specific exonuclease RecJ [Planctomycetota bacterium]REK39341.1 MAG: single-stranded-DNA-specific exonuclease RecJ [Planctomycetota bacterium]
MAKRWSIASHDRDRIEGLMRLAELPAIVAQLLVARGIDDPQQVGDFLDPRLTALRDPGQLPGIEAAVERITAAIESRERIVIYGDYDADGMTGTAILVRCLTLLGANVDYYVPNRLDEGYGLNNEALAALALRDTKLIVSVDCGIASVAESHEAARLGLELIITDHHQPAAERPQAAAIVHPGLPEDDYPFAGLSGAGVAFKLAWALCQRASGAKQVSSAMRGFLLQAVGLAAIGTVADVVPLVDENRVLVHHGLLRLADHPTVGVRQLLGQAKLDEKPSLSSEDIAFSLAPRLNAAGRLGQAALAVELLLTEDEERAHDLATFLDDLNAKRDTLQRSVYLAANKQAKEHLARDGDAPLVLAGRGWHVGVIGIVAGRLSDKYHRPVLLVALDELDVKPGVASGRSIPGFDLHAALSACDEHLISHGGHAAAAGFQVEPTKIDAFREAFCRHAAEQLSAAQLAAQIDLDGECPLAALTLKTVTQIERLAPFGEGNRRPLLCTSGVRLREPPKQLGSSGRHLALALTQEGVHLRCVAFGGGEWESDLAAVDGTLSIAFRPVINTFRGRRSVELHLVDWRSDAETDSAQHETAVDAVGS